MQGRAQAYGLQPPQGLKPNFFLVLIGTAEAVP